MLRLPAQIDLGPYSIHLDVLAARLGRKQRRRRRVMLCAVALFAVFVGTWVTLALLRGNGVVVFPTHTAALTIALNGRALPTESVRLPTGRYTLRFEQVGAFPVDQEIEVTKAQTTTVTLPVLRPIPQVQRLPLSPEQSQWASVSTDASGGWRLGVTRPGETETTTRPGWGAQATATMKPKFMHLNRDGISQLSVLDAYPVADEMVTSDGNRFWAAWEKSLTPNSAGVAGILTVTTPSGTQTLSTTVALQGLWWSPNGRILLAAVSRQQGVELALLDPRQMQEAALTPVMAMAGTVQTVAWHPDGRAVVVVTAPEPLVENTQAPPAVRPTQTLQTNKAVEPKPVPRDAVLLRLAPDGTPAQATRLHAPPFRPAGIVPLAWAGDDLWWMADTGLGLALERISLLGNDAARIGTLSNDIVAFTVLADGTVRTLRARPDGQFVVERWPEGTPIFTLPQVAANRFSGGIWHGKELLLATSSADLWYVQIEPEALQ